MTTFNPKLNPCATAQLVDLCKAREVGNVATPKSGAVDAQKTCSTFQSLIHGNSDNQVADASVPQQPTIGRFWRQA